MTKDEVLRKYKEYLFSSVATYYPEPLVTDHASMQYLWDTEGNKYLDFFGGIVTISAGHCNPRITSKIKAQIDRLQHASTVLPNEAIVAIAEKLAQITPGEIKKTYFTNSGTEANETAVQLARVFTGNMEIISLRHGYSGRSQLAQSLTGMYNWRASLPAGFGVVHAASPYCYRCPFGKTYPDCGVACAHDVENVIQTATSGRVAGFLAETILGLGGFVVPPKEYFKIAVTIVKKYGGLFIADEVQTAWGRTGKHWFGIEHWEVTPDIITSAKGLADGVPVGVTMTRTEIADSFKGMQISTFGGNPVTCVAAKATIDLIEEDRLMDNAEVVGNYFRQGLESLKQKYQLIGDVRGMGLMQGLELVKDRETKEPAPQETNQVLEEARRRGLIIGKGGLWGSVIRMSPPLNISKADVDDAVRILDQAFAAVQGGSVKRGTARPV